MAFNIQSLVKAVRGEGRRAAAFGLYGGLCAAALQPLMVAVQAGDPNQISAAAIALAGTAGAGLLTNLAQRLVDAPDTRRADEDERDATLAKLIEDAARQDSRTADALDAMLKQLNAIERAQVDLSGDDKVWFTEALRAELKDLGSSLTIDSHGAVVLGDVHVQNGDFVGRDKIVNIYGPANVDWGTYYLRQLMAQCNRLSLADMGDREDAENARDVMTLDQVYITLNVATRHWVDDLIAAASKPPQPLAANRSLVMSHDEIDRFIELSSTSPITELPKANILGSLISSRITFSARSAIARSELAVLHGAPGSGKSAFVRQLVAALCAAQLGEAQLPGVMRPLRELCPIVVNLRELAQRLKLLQLDGLPPQDKRKALQKVLWEQWESELDGLGVPDFKEGLRVKLLDGKALLVFDGLDEVAPEARPLARDVVNAAIKQYAKPPRAIVTVRTRSFDPALMPDFDAYELQPFDGDQIREFSRRWYAVQAAPRRWPAGYAEAQGDDLANTACGLPNDLASNPLLLTVIAIVHQDGKKLPPERVKLFDEAIEVLLHRWQRAKGRSVCAELSRLLDDDYRIHGGLSTLAYAAHEQQANAGHARGSDNAAADLTPAQIVALLGTSQYLRTEAMAREFLSYVDECAGLLVGNGGQDHTSSTYAFPHRTFQEYLAGRHMMAGRSTLRTYREKARQGDYWERAAQLGAEAQFYTPGNRDKLLDLIYNLCPPEPPRNGIDWRAALWSASMAVIDAHDLDWIKDDHEGASDPALQGGEAYLTRTRQRLLTIMRERKLPAIERAAAGRALAKLGDPREEVMTVEKMVFVPIAAGDFLAGDQNEKRAIQHPFWISQYPVTNAQFQQFVDDGGYTKAGNAEWWREAQEHGLWEINKGYRNAKEQNFRKCASYILDDVFGLPNHPVVGVSWYEALAFTRWLRTQDLPLQEEDTTEFSFAFRLPTESEWLKALHDGNMQRYPWGDGFDSEYANASSTNIGTTSAVGVFPKHEMQLNGIEEMIGNVWEWTLSPRGGTGGNLVRMIRGGSWLDEDDQIARSISLNHRRGPPASNAEQHIGFRVAFAIVPFPETYQYGAFSHLF